MDRIRNIKDLAVLAGVSAGTVSRALAGSELISLKTRERIKALATEHSFRPNALARNLRIQRTGAIGVVVPLKQAKGEQLSDPFFITMLGLVADALTDRGYDLLLSRVAAADDSWLDQFIGSGRVDGVLLIGQQDMPEMIDTVAARYRPLVVWGGHVPGQRACVVGSDNRLGGERAGGHLIERGCRHIAFVGDPLPLESAQRLEGARAVAEAAGVRFTVIPNREAFRETFGQGDHPDGLFACSDLIAANALTGLANAGLRAPDDVRVIGYDGLPICEQVTPHLSTIDQQVQAGARHLVDLLLRRIAGEEPGSVVLEPRVVVRDSS
ncbi:MAG: LacI family DNA-binding transcriptional regulator [Sphingomonadales bacterium]|nr:LacI family DNA-binding transcriptional regulator [Sphingomonadales bacterium]